MSLDSQKNQSDNTTTPRTLDSLASVVSSKDFMSDYNAAKAAGQSKSSGNELNDLGLPDTQFVDLKSSIKEITDEATKTGKDIGKAVDKHVVKPVEKFINDGGTWKPIKDTIKLGFKGVLDRLP